VFRLRRTAIIAGLSAALIGCGSKARRATDKTSLTDSVSPRVVARDRALGERALLRQADFQHGFNAAGRGGNEPPQEEQARHLLQRTAICVRSSSGRFAPGTASVLAHRNPATVSEEVGEVAESSPPEAPGGNIGIESVVTVEPTVVAAKESFSIVGQPQLGSCIGEAFRDEMLMDSPGLRKPGNSVSKARVAGMVFPRYGDQTVAYRLMFSLQVEGQNLSVDFDYVLARVGRADALLTFTRLERPVSGAMERRLTALTARRLARDIPLAP
jgi:hypothetical protein